MIICKTLFIFKLNEFRECYRREYRHCGCKYSYGSGMESTFKVLKLDIYTQIIFYIDIGLHAYTV